MSARKFLAVLCWASVLAFALLILSLAVFHAAPQGSGYRVIRTIHLGGEGGWDYVTVDADARRVYIPRRSVWSRTSRRSTARAPFRSIRKHTTSS